MTILKRKHIQIFLVIGVAMVLLGLGTVIFLLPQNSTPADDISDSQPKESNTEINETDGLKLYRNEEWGFEFQYLNDWAVEENYFKSYYSKFNLRVIPVNIKRSVFPVGINIVLPEFADRSFRGLEKTTSEVIIDGVAGVKYEYEFGGRQEIAIILPLGDLRMIIGTDDSEQYSDIFNQIVALFKFLK